ncbi:hypothetical protein [Alcaligenes phenolicus]|uniref:hypothetical protein n=1 Tax=Alcaligenes phenolicus TaxID=232846 RepID=UPI002AA80B47|nr:hypothetical protein [Alcaligenes phenolicus]
MMGDSTTKAQYRSMFQAACIELGTINEALGLDPDAGGAAPILAAIEQLRAEHAASLAKIEAFVACDASAISYQSLGQYRTALLRMLQQAPAEKEPGA